LRIEETMPPSPFDPGFIKQSVLGSMVAAFLGLGWYVVSNFNSYHLVIAVIGLGSYWAIIGLIWAMNRVEP
jgi:hypothetical protein